jgi:hypothetical protein
MPPCHKRAKQRSVAIVTCQVWLSYNYQIIIIIIIIISLFKEEKGITAARVTLAYVPFFVHINSCYKYEVPIIKLIDIEL